MPTSLIGIYRENVAALIMRKDRRLLIGECADKPGSWSFPQGGVDDGETRREALARELREEVYLGPRSYKILSSRSGYTYSYPPGRLKKAIYCGQMQTYFLCRLSHGEPSIGRHGKNKQEFLQLRWFKPEDLDLGLIPVIKREVTSKVMADFFGVVLAMPQEPIVAHAADNDTDVLL